METCGICEVCGMGGKGRKEWTDRELMEESLGGDEKAFEEIVKRYRKGLYGFLRHFVRHEDVEDILQETFLQLFISSGTFDMARPLQPWLYTIAGNKVKDLLRVRKQKRQYGKTYTISISINEGEEIEGGDGIGDRILSDDNSVTPCNNAQEMETCRRARRIVGGMPEDLRGIVLLAFYKGLTYKEMARELDIPIGTVKSRLNGAVKYFGKAWGKER